MELPSKSAVMTLPGVTLFPQALLPLYIFEPRYRRMLADALEGERMFTVAMRKPGSKRESPVAVGGLGLIRVAMKHDDGTSHLVLQGLARVELGPVDRYSPYRVHHISPLTSPPCDSVKVDALVAKMRELVAQHLNLGLPFPFEKVPRKKAGSPGKTSAIPPKQILSYLDSITDPEQAADLISCAILPGAAERQAILETAEVEVRLQLLIHFMLAEIREQQKNSPP